MKYQLSKLQLFATPNAEKMFEFKGLPQVEFEFPGVIRTALAISCGLVRASRHGGEDHYEVVFRLYESANPKETGENHVGKLYIRVFGYAGNFRFKPYVERFEWRPDGSFDVIGSDGIRHHFYKPDEAGEYSRTPEVRRKTKLQTGKFLMRLPIYGFIGAILGKIAGLGCDCVAWVNREGGSRSTAENLETASIFIMIIGIAIGIYFAYKKSQTEI